jgi:hypothetical protein
VRSGRREFSASMMVMLVGVGLFLLPAGRSSIPSAHQGMHAQGSSWRSCGAGCGAGRLASSFCCLLVALLCSIATDSVKLPRFTYSALTAVRQAHPPAPFQDVEAQQGR